ncbi:MULTISPECIES: phosphoadenosine phosphosulfate reductase [unclassified Roseovarius]|uniref:phosphoadenosine phosphosulfate reductase n=1 Tax=unclassified Roseovarius TaxID=2614913 RepID=UPI0027400561|nr:MULTISPECIES: phosphoadenosine phosphosulfate reductase [unclassified Roseovarius]
MKDIPDGYETPLGGLAWQDWLEKLTVITDDDGYTERLGARHAAILVEEKPTLLVTFETHQGISMRSDLGHPMGWEMVKALGWSHLCLVSDGDTWFRDPHVYAYFDRLVDDGFLEDFDQVIFYGAGACGYAAAAFSVAAPGAQVLVLQPQATLDPGVTEWDPRFRHMRRTSFTDRYGYAPDMLEAAKDAVVIYDPNIREDAMHAALFNRPNVTRFRMRHLGAEMEKSLLRMNILLRMIAQHSAGKLDRKRLARLYRSRRDDATYQFNLLKRLTTDNRPYLVMLLAGKVLEKREAPAFRKAFARARNRLGLISK